MKTQESPQHPTQRRGCYSQHRRAIRSRPSSRRTARLREIPGRRSRPSTPHLRVQPAPLPRPRLTPLRALTAPHATAVRAAAPTLTSPLTPSRAAGRAWRAVPRPLTSGVGTREAECRGAQNPLSSSPARRSALRGTPSRPGLPSQSDGTPPPLVAAAASASFSGSSRRGRRHCDRRHLDSDGVGGGGDRGL